LSFEASRCRVTLALIGTSSNDGKNQVEANPKPKKHLHQSLMDVWASKEGWTQPAFPYKDQQVSPLIESY